MKTQFAFAALFVALSQTSIAADAYFARVDASFEAMLSHQPYAGPTAVTVARNEIDPAAAYIHASLRGEQTSAVAGSQHEDQVLASFDRMLNHPVYAGPTTVTVARGDEDAAAVLIHARLRGEPASMTAQQSDAQQDQVAASFARMLAHAPYTGATNVSVTRETDYQVDRLIFARRLEQNRKGTMLAGK